MKGDYSSQEIRQNPLYSFFPLGTCILLKIGTKYSTEDKIEARIAHNE